MSRPSSTGGTTPRSSPTLLVDAGPKPLTELLRVASAAARSGTRIGFTGTRRRPLEDLMRIAVAGGDCVSFELQAPAERPDRAEPERGAGAAGRAWPLRRLFSRTALG